MSLLPAGTRAWIITDGKAGLLTHCTGLAQALGVVAGHRRIDPNRFWSALMPYGPVDPGETPARENSPIAPPFPDMVIASGRRTLPYLREIKRASGGAVFTAYLQDPAIGTGAADVICVPQHDILRGDNVLTSLTSPHGMTQAVLAAARRDGDARLAGLPHPRLAMILGGNSAHFRFSPADATALAEIAVKHSNAGYGVMLTPSRRTPDAVLATIRTALAAAEIAPDRTFIWDRAGANPYVAMVALADALVVTGDSVNMLGEATATGKPVYVYVPSGKGHPKITRFHQGLYAAGAARPYAGAVEVWGYEPLDATPELAREVARRYRAFRG